MKKVRGVYGNRNQHWVGDGFPVRSLFSYGALGRHVSPFLLLDYAGPAVFGPAAVPRGVGEHPHRDSTGAGGLIQCQHSCHRPSGSRRVDHGPFVMNTADEIEQAYADLRDGRFGRIPPHSVEATAAEPAH